MIDLHCHLLPNIDDGSRSVERSAAVLAAFARDGVTHVVLTPHLAASELADGGEEAIELREHAFQELKAAVPASPRLSLGFEIMLDQPFPLPALGDRRFALAGSRYYLVEFPLSVVPGFAAKVLEQMARAGTIPIVAHPERYEACSPDAVGLWRAAGARIQLDATTLTRPRSRGRRARELLEHGLADIVAADNHGDQRTIRTAAEYLDTHATPRVREMLTRVNPAAVMEDGEMQDAGPLVLRTSWGERIARLFGGG